MIKRSIARCTVGCLAAMCFVTLGCNDSSIPGGSLLENEPPVRRAMYVSIPEVFGDHLDRPPVKFDHDKHTAALESEGCGTCHATDNHSDLLFHTSRPLKLLATRDLASTVVALSMLRSCSRRQS